MKEDEYLKMVGEAKEELKKIEELTSFDEYNDETY